jgi:hypothetical protein
MDVDGVVNAWHADKAWGLGMESDDICDYILAWSIKMARRMGSLLDDGLELVWVSGWLSDALLVSEAIGWEGRGRILRPSSGELSHPSIYWKAEAIWDDLAEYAGQWAWIDSGVGQIAMDREYSDLVSGEGYVPAVDGDIGITPDMVTSIELRMDRERTGLGLDEGGV